MAEEIFSRKVRIRLAELDMTQAEAARKMGSTPSQFQDWLEVGKPPGTRNLLKMARALGVSMEYLADDAIEPGDPRHLKTEEELKILEMVRVAGYEESLRRMMAVPPKGSAFSHPWGGEPMAVPTPPGGLDGVG